MSAVEAGIAFLLAEQERDPDRSVLRRLRGGLRPSG
jgi:hypothetical protein